MSIQGMRDTSNFVTNQAPENWREGIMLLFPNGKMPLTALTSLMKKRSVDDPRFHWWDKELTDRRVAASADVLIGGTTLPVVSGALAIKKRDILWVEQSSEYVEVTADPTTDTSLTIARGFGGSTAAAIDFDGAGKNPNLVVVGSAYEEGSTSPAGVNFDPVEHSNFTQIFRNTLEATRTAIKTRLRTGDQVKEAKRECLEMHGMDLERAFWLGIKSSGTLNGRPRRSTGGVINQIAAANIKVVTTDHATGLDMAGLEEYMYSMFQYGSSEKLAICGNRALLTINQVLRKNAAAQFMMTTPSKEFGMNVTRLISPFGELVMKTAPLFNNNTGGITAATAYHGMESWMVVLDMENVQYVHLKDSDTSWKADLQDNDLDGMKAGYLTEAALELHHPKTHFVLKEIVAAKAD